MRLEILDVIRKTNMNDIESIVSASSEMFIQLVNNIDDLCCVDEKYQHLAGLESTTWDRQYDVCLDLAYLQNKFERDIKDILWYCAKEGIQIE